MASRLFSVLVLSLAISAHSAAQAETPPTSQKSTVQESVAKRWVVIGECQMVILPQKEALSLLPDLLDEKKIEAAYAQVQTMIQAGRATQVAKLVARSQESKREVIA